MSATPMPLPDDLRRAARAAAWPNRDSERAGVAAIDEAVMAKVAVHEAYLAETADKFADQTRDTLKDSDAALSAVTDLTASVRRGDTAVDAASAAAYKLNRARIAKSLDDLAYAESHIAWLVERCADPYASVTRILEKFASLRAGRGYDL